MNTDNTAKDYIIALDTHNYPGSIAIGCNNLVLGVIELQTKVSHTKRLIECLNFLFTQLSINPSQVKSIAINRGPGSFTGLRIGLSFVKGFAFPIKADIIGFDTCTLLAHAVVSEMPFIAACVDAGRNEIYCRLFEHKKESITAISDFYLLSPHKIAQVLDEVDPKEIVLVGNGALKYQSVFQQSGYIYSIPGEIFLATIMLKLAFSEKGDILNSERLDAIYIRKSDAELKKV
jgi:tRNA threonylcarbamoyladenosine biosynthesis protein TsaB